MFTSARQIDSSVYRGCRQISATISRQQRVPQCMPVYCHYSCCNIISIIIFFYLPNVKCNKYKTEYTQPLNRVSKATEVALMLAGKTYTCNLNFTHKTVNNETPEQEAQLLLRNTASAMHFFVAKLLSITVIMTYSYIYHLRPLRPANLLRTQQINFNMRPQHVRMTRDPTVVWSLLSRELLRTPV